MFGKSWEMIKRGMAVALSVSLLAGAMSVSSSLPTAAASTKRVEVGTKGNVTINLDGREVWQAAADAMQKAQPVTGDIADRIMAQTGSNGNPVVLEDDIYKMELPAKALKGLPTGLGMEMYISAGAEDVAEDYTAAEEGEAAAVVAEVASASDLEATGVAEKPVRDFFASSMFSLIKENDEAAPAGGAAAAGGEGYELNGSEHIYFVLSNATDQDVNYTVKLGDLEILKTKVLKSHGDTTGVIGASVSDLIGVPASTSNMVRATESDMATASNLMEEAELTDDVVAKVVRTTLKNFFIIYRSEETALGTKAMVVTTADMKFKSKDGGVFTTRGDKMVLAVRDIDKNSEEYKQAAATLQNNNVDHADFAAVDISFRKGGADEDYEPCQGQIVNVRIETKAIENFDPESMSIQHHLDDGSLETVAGTTKKTVVEISDDAAEAVNNTVAVTEDQQTEITVEKKDDENVYTFDEEANKAAMEAQLSTAGKSEFKMEVGDGETALTNDVKESGAPKKASAAQTEVKKNSVTKTISSAVDANGVKTEVQEEQGNGDIKVEDGKVVADFVVDSFSIYTIVGQEINTIEYLSADGNTYEVTVDLRGVTNIPEGAELVVDDVAQSKYDSYLNQAAKALKTNADAFTYAKLLDIFIVYEGQKIQPNGKVGVEIQLKDGEDISNPQVVHFGQETEVLDAAKTGNGVAFATTGFSVYAIVEEDGIPQPARVTFEFEDPNNADFTFIDKAGNPQTTQIIKDGEKLQDVGLPTIPEGETFNGWFIYYGENPVEAISFDSAIAVAYGEAGAGSSVSASRITIDPEDLDQDGTYHVQVKAFFGEVVYLTFYEDAAGTNILNRIQIAKGSEYNIATQTVTAPNSELAFQGWNETAGSNDDDREAIISTTMTFNDDDSFYPIFKSGHWITFYAGATGSGADYTAPVFVIAGGTASGAQPSNPEWKGYAFQYWTETNIYTGENGSYVQPTTAPTRFDFNNEISEAKTLYAYWTPADTTYTVVFWQQNVGDSKNATNDQKTYSFAEQITEHGTSGTTVPATNYAGRYTGYTINTNKSDTSVVVKADGTSILNIYFDRQLITMRFYRTAGTRNNQGQTTAPVSYNSGNWTNSSYANSYTGLYGQTWTQAGYTTGWPTPSTGTWMYYDSDYVNGYNTSGNNYGPFTGMTFLGQFVLPDGVYDTDKVEIRLFSVNVNTATLEFYLQNVDGTTYPETPSDTGTGQRRATFYFSEKYDGFTVSEYRRYRVLHGVWYNGTFYEGNYQGATNQTVYFNSNGVAVQNGDGAWATAAVDGSASLARGNNDYFDLQVRYARKHYTLKYLDSVDNTELQGISNQDVVFGESLSGYLPEDSFTPVSQYPGKVWDGKWYKDQACSEEFDWSITMPNADMVVYAGWEDVYYKVDIDPNGGTLTEGESTLFWRTYGQTVQRYDDVVRDYAEDPDGNYKYEDFLRSKYEAAGYDPWDYDGYLRTARYVSSDTITTVPMVPYGETEATETFTYPYDSTRYSYEKGAYALIGWYELTFEDGHYGDLNYVTGESLYNFGTGVTHDTYIQAKWRRVGEYHVEYKPNVYLMDADGNISTTDSSIETTNLPSDRFSYADQSQSSIMRSPDSPITRTVGEGGAAESKQYVFQGWYYNGQLYTPGDVFTVLSSLAEDKVIGHDDEHDADIIQKTVYIYPVYQSVDDLPVDVTHIYWYSNWQDTDGNVIPGRTEANQLKDETNNELQPNEAVDIDYIDKLLNGSNAYEGYTFLGWAKSPTARTPWLTYNSETGKFSTVKDGVTYDNVTQVAADEVLPYEDLYAVWEINKYTVTVTKTVAGTGADQHRGFTFAPVFTGYSGGSNFILAGEETTVTDEDTGTTYTYNTSKEFTEVPYGATLTLTENQEVDYDTTVKYTVTSNADGTAIENPEDVSSTNGAKYTIKGDITIAYTNTLKTTTVTVKKSLVNPYIDSQTGKDFSFTARYADADPITFTVNSSNDEGYTIENVPVGVEMVITETTDTVYEYSVSAVGTSTTDSDSVDNTYTFTVPTEAETVIFTNTIVTTGINVTKTDDKTPANGLPGAQFTLMRNDKLDGTGEYVTVDGLYSSGITSGSNGEMIVSSDVIPTGYYKLTETKSPDGYIILSKDIEFQVSKNDDGDAVITLTESSENASLSEDAKTLFISNTPGKELPKTGGSGTLPYTLGGFILMISALMYGFMMRRRERRLM